MEVDKPIRRTAAPSVGIVTWHCLLNVGSNLQAYGLYKGIEGLGYQPTFINYRKPYQKENPLVAAAKDAVSCVAEAFPRLVPMRMHYGARRFQRKYFTQTAVAFYEKDLAFLSDAFDVYVSGSDQIWSPKRYNPVFMLSFVPDSAPRMSYASSVGTERIPAELQNDYRRLLGRYDHISVREDNASDYLTDLLKKPVAHVLDPCFLLEASDWAELEKPVAVPDKYVFTYIIGKSEKYREDVRRLADEKGAKVVAYTDVASDAAWADVHHSRLDPREFIYLVRNADVVATDSYHGMVFSLIFEKQFVPFLRFSRDDQENENSRVMSLLRQTELVDILIDEQTEVSQPAIDYPRVSGRLEKLKEYSRGYLETSLADCLEKKNARVLG